ncbi:MAG: DUF1028 domain-containing protein [Phycisphaerales bacterium]
MRATGSGGRVGRLAMAAGACVGLAAASADATWSICIVNVRTGEVALASATCLTGFDMREDTPVLITGVGGATAQSAVDTSGRNRGLIRNLLLAGVDPQQILVDLEAFDAGHQTRQYGIIDVTGGVATFSGSQDSQWAGGQTGQIGDLVYAVQGNILTGAPVVQAAVDAILMTPGDIPEKLMAAMEGAYMFGGDGRCSCDQGPQDCGSPPNGGDFDKSAHVGYMLIARAGDTDAANGFFDTEGWPTGMCVLDIDSDGRPDVVGSLSTASNNAVVFRNLTGVGVPLSLFGVEVAGDAGASDLQSIACGELTGDAQTDLLTVSFAGDSVQMLAGQGGGAFAPGVSIPVGDGPRDVVIADLDGMGGLDAATANELGGTVSLLMGAGDGTFKTSEIAPLGGACSLIVAGEFDGMPGIDLAVLHKATAQVSVLFNDGAGNFTPGALTSVGANPMDMTAGDIDHDGLDEILVANNASASVSVLRNLGGAFFDMQIPSADGRNPLRLELANLDGDDDPDLVVLISGGSTLSTYLGDGMGGFDLVGAFKQGAGPRSLAVADFNGDGLDDVLEGAVGVGGAEIADNLGGGVFQSIDGYAGGDYYMVFNIAGSHANDPDPVLQMRGLFDQFRIDQTGRPDAVQSSVSVPTGLIASGDGGGVGGTTARVRVNLFDWRRVPVDLDASAFSVAHATGSDAVTQVQGVERVGPGRYDIVLEIGEQAGEDRLVVTVDDGVRPVTLMPSPVVRVLVAGADFDGDGVAGFGDVLAFILAFAAQDPSADLSGDSMFTIDDVLLFLAFYGV